MRIDELCINTIRFLAVDAVQKANSGHPGMPMGDAAMAYVLWNKFLKHNPKNPLWMNRDRFVLSAGHGSMLLYSLLHLTGYPLSLKDIKNFRQWGSKTPGHPEYDPETGIETTTGPLGQGFATGVGMAIAERYLREYFNKPGFPIVDFNIYAICSDGDLMEGVSSEAASLAGHLGLGNLIYLYSDNKITIEGSTDLAFTEDVAARFRAYGWHVQGVDGNDLKAIERVIREAKREKTRPSLIVARTHIAYGSPNKEGTPEAHGAPLGEEEVSLSKKNLGWPETPRFYVPGEALKHMKKAVGKGRAAENKWTTMTRRYRRKYPDLYNRFLEFTTGNLPDGWDSGLPEFRSADGPMATRSASGKVLNVLAGRVHNIIGGSADLAPSNNTYLKSFPVFGVKKKGRNIHFGVREHAMGAALNGMALTGGIIPYGGTFLIFSDYMRPAIRLASLMKQHVIYVFTHDSIALGEDGPTHQPVEQLSSLRSIPNFTEIRPADANETREAWKIALQHGNGPVALILTRQKVPVIDRKTYASEVNIRKGAYILADSGGKPELIILASGSEVHLAIEAYEGLVKQGMKVRVVNMASFRLFDGQSERYKKKVLPDDCRKRLAVEAGSSLSWYKYVGIEGDVVGVDRFGASAPYKVIYEKFGLTVDNIVGRSIKLLKK
ncbi:transketolase [bacterium BMS3Bbin06]|nr:transketolase [bacterium BMS3Abin08]GBE34169.1 transketolase [bacterium BMS3Bbin06]HDO36607.1 transketolase [Nitrospirota bacterium]HDY71248.1 transketolase [Nitrospirota bacterium]